MKQHLLYEAVRAHLALHPGAADSLVGIRQWWLPEALRATPLEPLREAIESLVAEGEMRRDPLPDGTTLYAGTRDDSKSDGDEQEHSKRS